MKTNTKSPKPRRFLRSLSRNEPLLRLWRQHESSGAAAEAIYRTLREAILRGLLAPGERLGEADLANVFNRSRTPIREAILRLESERLAQRLARRGTVVGTIARGEIMEVYAVREMLDGLAARLSARSILPLELEELSWLNQRLRDAAERGEYDEMVDLNIQFHETLCQASRNTFLLQFMRQIHDWVRRFQKSTFSYPGRSDEAIGEHEDLLEALRRRDADAAEDIARRHMVRAGQVRVALLQAPNRVT